MSSTAISRRNFSEVFAEKIPPRCSVPPPAVLHRHSQRLRATTAIAGAAVLPSEDAS
ncbi:hypothetical protein GCM10022402_13440 [Salinactinospora qingdaonensis]|uniref:Uncharacterized protein n=1 Tax=Salinactinospora qingdaonensis TaxID=702744 RepID=A0ABP7FFH1_9ACTN